MSRSTSEVVSTTNGMSHKSEYANEHKDEIFPLLLSGNC